MAVSVVANTTDASLMDTLLDVSTELIWFSLGVVIFRCFTLWRRSHRAAPRPSRKQRKSSDASTADPSPAQFADWIKVKAAGLPVPTEYAKALGRTLAESHPEHLDDFVSYLGQHLSSIPIDAGMMNAWLATLANTGNVEYMHTFAKAVESRLGLNFDIRSDELLLGASVVAGNEQSVSERIANFTSKHQTLTSGACVQLAWGYLHVRNTAEAARWVHDCFTRGVVVPPRLLSQLFKAASEMGPEALGEVLDGLKDKAMLTSDCASAILRECLAQEDVATAQRVQRMAAGAGLVLATSATEAVLKLFATAGDPAAVPFFEDAVAKGFVASQGFCGSVLSKCAESKFLELIEAVGAYLKAHESFSLTTGKTLMKAYACCGVFDRACELFLFLEKHGPEPDLVMRACVMRFAIFCGDMQLCMRIMGRADSWDPQAICTLIRAAAQDEGAHKMNNLLEHLDGQVGFSKLDISVSNAAMDGYLIRGDLAQASRIFERAKAAGQADGKTFSIMARGHCSANDLDRAGNILEEMAAAGHPVEGFNYNSFLSTAAAAGDMRRVWAIFRRLEKRGTAIDAYALSIMMKAARSQRTAAEAEPFLALLDKHGGVICTDAILLNTVLDACIQHRDVDRLAVVLEAYRQSGVPATVQTYGLLIKASSCTGDVRRCKEMWNEMTTKQGLEPNTMTLGCMVDALVSAHQLEDAVQLVRVWKKSVSVNTVIYSTLMKGFASDGHANRAMEIATELKAEGLHMNTVSYTTLIDAHARSGKMDVASDLLEQMEEDGCDPNTITFSTLIKGHCIQGNMDSALKLFQDMVLRGLQADAVVFNTLLDSCVKHSHFELADSLLIEMANMSIVPSTFTLSIITKMWGKRRRLDKAFEAMRTLTKEHALKPDAKNGTSLISACFACKSADDAITAFEDMRSWRHHRGFNGPDNSTYGALIAGLVRSGRLRKAATYAEEACAGTPPRISMSSSSTSAGVSALKLLFRELSNEGLDRELGRPILDKLTAAGERSFAVALAQAATTPLTSCRHSRWT